MTATIPGVGKIGSRSAGSFSVDLNGEYGNGASNYSLKREAEAFSVDTCTEDIEKQ
jgi:hypothetical protein